MYIRFLSHCLFIIATVYISKSCFAVPAVNSSLSSQEAIVTIYVSTNGNDSWSGNLPEANTDRTDGPLASISQAAELLTKLRPAKPARILIRGGTYRIDKPIVFFPRHSGSKTAQIIYAAYPGEKPIISGGRSINGWKKSDGPLWTTTIDAVKQGKWYFRELFVNGKRAIPARTPNDNCFLTDGFITDGTNKMPWLPGKEGKSRTSLVYRENDIRQWPDIDDAVIVAYHYWLTSQLRIKSLDVKNHIVNFVFPSHYGMGRWFEHQRFYVEGIRSALDSPGEFHLDRKTGVLSYYPLPGEDIKSARFVAPVIPELLILKGEATNNRYVEHLVFEGISFQHTGWRMPTTPMRDRQANAHLPHATIRARCTKACLFKRCEIAHTGSYGLWLQNGCKNNRVEQCYIHDLAAGGIRLGEIELPHKKEFQAEHNEVFNCFISDGGNVFQSAVGVWIGKSSYNKVHHCEISDFFYSGVSVGWCWNYAPSSAHHNQIKHNHIHHLGYGQLGDMGGIYHLGRGPGTQFCNNHIHDILSQGFGGWGIYTDQASSDILIENNIVYRVRDGAFRQHFGSSESPPAKPEASIVNRSKR